LWNAAIFEHVLAASINDASLLIKLRLVACVLWPASCGLRLVVEQALTGDLTVNYVTNSIEVMIGVLCVTVPSCTTIFSCSIAP
jgi:hypothetical protein